MAGPIIPMKNWLDKADPELINDLRSSPASGRYFISGQFGIAGEDEGLRPIPCETQAEPDESVLDVIRRLNLLYLSDCKAQGVKSRFMLAVSQVSDNGQVHLDELFFWATGNPNLILRKNTGRARGTYKVLDAPASNPETGEIEYLRIEATAKPGENLFHLLYRMNRMYVEVCQSRGLIPEVENGIYSITTSKFVVLGL